MATDSTHLLPSDTNVETESDMSAPDFAGVQLAAATGGAIPVNLPQGQRIVVIPVQPGQTIELPTDSVNGLLAKIGSDGNLAIVVDGRTIILQGYAEANAEAPIRIVTNDGDAVDITEVILATNPDIAVDIQTAAGPAAAGAQGGTDAAGSGIFIPFAAGPLLGGFDPAGVLGATELQYKNIDDDRILFVTEEASTDEPDGDIEIDPETVVGEVSFAGGFEDWQPDQDGCEPPVAPMALNVTFTPADNEVLLTLKLSGFPQGSILYIGDPTDGIDPGESQIPFGDADPANNVIALSPDDIAKGIFVLPPQDASGNIDLDYVATIQDPDSGETKDLVGTKEVVIDAVAEDAEIDFAQGENPLPEQSPGAPEDPDTTSADCEPVAIVIKINEDNAEECEFESAKAPSLDSRLVPIECCPVDGEPIYPVGFTASTRDDDGSEGITRVVVAFSENESDGGATNNDADAVAVVLNDQAKVHLGGGVLGDSGTIVVDGAISLGDDGVFIAAKVTLAYEFTSDGLVFTIDGAEVGGNAVAEPFAVQSLDLASLQIELPQHDSDDFRLDVTVTTNELFIDGELTDANNEATHTETLIYNIVAIADGGTIDGGDEGHPEEGCEVQKFVEDNQPDSSKHGPEASESNLQVPVTFTASLTDADGSEGIVEIKIFLSANLGGSDILSGLTFLDNDGELTGGNSTITLGLSGGGTAEFNFNAAPTLSGWEITLTPVDPAAILGKNVSLSDLIIQTPVDDSTDIRADFYVTTGEFQDGQLIGESCHVGSDCVVYEIAGVVGPAVTEFNGDKDFIEDGGEEGVCQTDETGPLRIDLGGIKGAAQDNDGSEGVVLLTLLELPEGFSYVDGSDAAFSDGDTVALTATKVGDATEYAVVGIIEVTATGEIQITIQADGNTPANGWDSLELDPGQIKVEAPQDFSGDFTVDYTVTTEEFDDDGTGGDTFSTPGSITFSVAPGSDDPIVDVIGNDEEGESSKFYEDGQALPANQGGNSETTLYVPVNFTADVGDPSEGLTKFTVAFSFVETGAVLQVWDGVSFVDVLDDGDANTTVPVVIDGHAGAATFEGGVLTVLFDAPVPAGSPALNVSNEIRLGLPVDDSNDLSVTVSVFSSELDENGDALDPDGHCSSEEQLPITIVGVVAAAVTDFTGDKDFIEDGAKDAEECQTPNDGPLFIDLGGLKAETQDVDGSEGVMRIVLKALPDGFGYVDGNGQAFADGDTVVLTVNEFGGATSQVNGTIEEDGGVITITLPATGWDVVVLDPDQIQVQVPQNFSGDFDVDFSVRTQEFDDDGGGTGTTDTDGSVTFHVDPAPDEPTVDVDGNDEDGDSSTFYEDNQPLSANQGGNSEATLYVPVDFTANVGDPSEGLTKFTVAFSLVETGAVLQLWDGVAFVDVLDDGDANTTVPVVIDGHTGAATFEGGVLTVVFDTPVPAGAPALAVSNEIRLGLPIDDSNDFDATVSVYSSELNENGDALDPDGHCSSEDTLAVSVLGVVAAAVTGFTGDKDFIEDGGEEGVCQTPEDGPLLIDLGGLKAETQDADGSEGVMRVVLKTLPAGFFYLDGNGQAFADGDTVVLTVNEFGGATSQVNGTIDVNGGVITITLPASGWDVVVLDPDQIQVQAPQNFSGDFDVDFSVRTQEFDDDGGGTGTTDTDGKVTFHVDPATDDPTVDVYGNSTVKADSSSFVEDGTSDPTKHGADAGENNIEVAIDFQADVTDPSEGLVKVEITFDDHDPDATLEINGVTVGALPTAVTVDGESASATFDGTTLIVAFTNPVGDANLPLNVSGEIKLVLPIDDSEDFTAKVEVFSSELNDEGEALEPDGHCSADATLTVDVKGIVGPAAITGLKEQSFDEDGGLPEGEDCQDSEQGPLFMPVAFKIAAQDNDGSESIVGFAIDIRQDSDDGDDAFVDGLTFVDSGGDPLAVGDKLTVNGWLLGEDPNADPAHPVEVEITAIDGSGKITFQVNTAGEWQNLELDSGEVQIEAPQNGSGDFELVVDATTEEHDDDGGLNDQYTTTAATGSLVQHYTVDPVNDDPLADDLKTPADVPGSVPAGALTAAGIAAADLTLFKLFTVDGTVDGNNVEDPSPTLGGEDVETSLANLVFEITALPDVGVLVKFDGVTYTAVAVGTQFDSNDVIYWLTDKAGDEDLTTAFNYKVIDEGGCEDEATALITGVDAAAGTLTAEGCVYEDLKPDQNVGDSTELPEILSITFTPNDDEAPTGGSIDIPTGWQIQVWDPLGNAQVGGLLGAGNHVFTQSDIENILDGTWQLRPIPPADSDVDATFTLSIDVEDPDTGATNTISSDFTVYADAAADKPTGVEIILKDSGDAGGSFAVGETGTLQVKATFGDYTDGSETHTVTVTLEDGFTAPTLLANGVEDGFAYTYNSATGVIVFTVPDDTQSLDVTFDVKAPAEGPLPTTLSFKAEAKAVETTTGDGGCADGDVEDTTNNIATTVATAGVPATRILNGEFITNTNVNNQQLLITFVSAANFLLASSQIYALDIQGQEGSVAQDVGFDIEGEQQYLLSVESVVNPKVILTDFTLESTTLLDQGNLQFELNDTGNKGPDRTAYTWVMTPDDATPDQAATESNDGDDKANALADPSVSFEYIYGAGGVDTINGGAGADILNGGDKADTVNGNGGNDILVYDPLDTFNGGTGSDLLRIDQGAIEITKFQVDPIANPLLAGDTVVNLSGKSITNIEGILITTEAQPDPDLGTTIQLKAADVLNYSATDELYVLGQSGDTVQLLDAVNWIDGDGNAGNGVTASSSFTNAAGQTFNVYQIVGGGTLNVDADVAVVS